MQIVGLGNQIVGISGADWSKPWTQDLVNASAHAYISTIMWVTDQHYLTANQTIWHDLNLSGEGTFTSPLGLSDPIIIGDLYNTTIGSSGIIMYPPSSCERPFEINDLFYVNNQGGVSAKFEISANGYKLGPSAEYHHINI